VSPVPWPWVTPQRYLGREWHHGGVTRTLAVSDTTAVSPVRWPWVTVCICLLCSWRSLSRMRRVPTIIVRECCGCCSNDEEDHCYYHYC